MAKDQKTTQNERNKERLLTEVISLKRVAKVTAGGKRLRFSAVVAVGDGAGNIGIALAHGREAPDAIRKAIDKAKNKMMAVPIVGEQKTVPFRLEGKFRSARIIIKPAAAGAGIVAGGSVRQVLTVAGYQNVVAKQVGAANSVANAYATLHILHKMKEKLECLN